MRHGNRLLDLLGIELPIIQAPMAGSTTPEMVVAVSNAGGLGSLPSALYTEAQLREALNQVRAGTSKAINLNFFCHAGASHDTGQQSAWRRRLAKYYLEEGLDADVPIPEVGRAPFDDAFCTIVEEYRPEVVRDCHVKFACLRRPRGTGIFQATQAAIFQASKASSR